METIVVTRHPALVAYLREEGIITDDAQIMEHVSEEEVRGWHVVGVLPLHLAAAARMVTVVPLDLPPEARGRELTVEEVRRYAGPPQTFVVRTKEAWTEMLDHLYDAAVADGAAAVAIGPTFAKYDV